MALALTLAPIVAYGQDSTNRSGRAENLEAPADGAGGEDLSTEEGTARKGRRQDGFRQAVKDKIAGKNPSKPQTDYVMRRQKLLEFTGKYLESVEDSYQAIGFACLGVLEHHRRAQKPRGRHFGA